MCVCVCVCMVQKQRRASSAYVDVYQEVDFKTVPLFDLLPLRGKRGRLTPVIQQDRTGVCVHLCVCVCLYVCVHALCVGGCACVCIYSGGSC